MDRNLAAAGLDFPPPDDLARIMGACRGRLERRALLDVVYGWFAEGFDRVDLVEAKTLLEVLT